MGWPLSQDYNEAVQNPRTSFADPELRDGEVVPGPMGLPLPRSGNFADVYQLRAAGGETWAVKCFTRHVAGLQERYAKIANHLRTARLPFTVRFTFLNQGIRVRGIWYPVLKMRWVEGFTLNEFVRTHAERPDYVKALLGLWVRLSRRLRDARIAHADLQHGNILLVPAASANKLSVRLIDYDGMWTPSLAGTPSGEVGHPAYQHPARVRDRIYSADVDRFPHLVIATALRATAVAGKRLWDAFDNGDNLLFRESDLAAPERSKLFRTLWDLDDPTVTRLVALLVDYAARPLTRTPWLDEVLTGDRPMPGEAATLGRAAERLGVALRSSRTSGPTDDVFSVPEQANAFDDLAEPADRSEYKPKPKSLALPLLAAAGGIVLVASLALVAVLAWRNTRPDLTDPGPEASGETKADVRPAGLGASWTAIASGPPKPRTYDLSDGVLKFLADNNSPKQFPLRQRATLGIWILPDGDRAVVATPLGVWVTGLTGKELSPIVRDVGELVRVAVSPDGRFVVTAGADRAIRCWDIRAGAGEDWVRTFPGTVTALEVTPDGQRVAASGEQVGYVEWAIATGGELRRHEALRASRLAFTDDGLQAMAAHADGVEFWSLADGQVMAAAPDFLAVGVCVDASNRGYALGRTGVLKSWEMKSGRPRRDLQLNVRSHFTAIEAGGDLVYAATDGGDVIAVRPDGTGEAVSLTGGAQAILSLAPTRNGSHVLVGLGIGPAQLVRLGSPAPKPKPKSDPSEPAAFRVVRELTGPTDPVAVGLSTDGARMVVAGPSKAIVVQTSDFAEILQVPADAERVIRGAALVDDRLVLSDSRADETGGRVRVFDRSGKQVGADWELPNPTPLKNLRPVPGQSWLLADVGGLVAVLFDVTSGKPVERFLPGRNWSRVSAVPDAAGERIACILGTGSSSLLHLWSVRTKALGPPLDGSRGVAHVAIAPGGRRIIGVWPYGRIKVWDAATGKLEREVEHEGVGRFQTIHALSDELAIVETETERMGFHLTTGKYLTLADVPSGRIAWFPKQSWLTGFNPAGRITILKTDVTEAARSPEAPAPRMPKWDARLVRDAVGGPAADVVYSTDAKKVIAGTTGGRIVRYTADRLLVDRELDTGEPTLTGLGRGPDRLFTHGPKFGVRMWNADTFEKLVDFADTRVAARLFGVRPGGGAFYLVADRMTVTEVKPVKKGLGPVSPRATGQRLLVAYSADEEVAVSQWGNGYIAAFREKEKREKALDPLPDKSLPVGQALALSPTGKYAALGTKDGRVVVWQTLSGAVVLNEVVPKFGDELHSVTDAGFLPGDRSLRFLTAGTDGRTILWDLDTKSRVREFAGLPGSRKLRIAEDGRSAVVHGPAALELFDLP